MRLKLQRKLLYFAILIILLIITCMAIAFYSTKVFAATVEDCPITITGTESGLSYSSGDFTNERVTVQITDEKFTKIYYKPPIGTAFTYTRTGTFTTGISNGLYTFYVANDNDERSPEYTILFDNKSPIGQLYSCGQPIGTSVYVYDEFYYSATDGGVGVETCYYKTPLDSDYSEYVSGTKINVNDPSGRYSFYSVDKCGNESEITTVFFKSPITAFKNTWVSAGQELTDNAYTNKELTFVFDDSEYTATYFYNEKDCGEYTLGQQFIEDGNYTVILTDLENYTTTFTATIDTVPPTGQLYANYIPVNNNSSTREKIYFTWEGDYSATVNGNDYAKNSVLIEDSVYEFVLTDKADNSMNYVITIDTIPPFANRENIYKNILLISKWITVETDSIYSFSQYDEALAFACEYEFEHFVKELYLDNVEDFNQQHLVANNSEIRVGDYWLYKSKTNPNILLYYFDKTLLDEVVSFYAEKYPFTLNYLHINSNNVYGEPAGSMTDNVFTAPDGTTAPVLNGFIFDKADGSELNAELVGGNGESVKIEYGIAFDKQISVGGLYKLTERDEAGNVTVFYGFMDVLAPELKATATIIGNHEPTELVIAKQNLTGGAAFYYESFSVNEIADADKWSVLTVENGGKKSCYTYGDELPCLNVGGEYLLTVYDRLGNGFSFTVYIIGNPATIDFKSNSDDTEFRLSITLEQKFDTLVSLEIRKDGKLLDGVSTDTLSYTFDRAGTYTVLLRDNFGRVISKEYTFNKAKPNGELSGVNNGGKTKFDVKFTYDSEKFYAVIAKDGQAVKTDRSGEITFTASDENSGIYAIRLIRLTDEENYSDYGFTMNTLASEFDLTVSDGSTTNKNVTVSWTATDVESVVFTLNGGEPVALENGGILSAEGVYTVTATNDLGTHRVKTFTIDKTVDYSVEVGAQPARNVEVTNENIAVFNGETLSVSVMKNGEPYGYAFGDVLSDEGFYTFRLSDDFGNSANFSVTIDKSISYSANIGNGLIASENVQLVNGEKLTVTVTKDNQVIDYEFGQPLEAEGAYKVLMKDAYGNEKTLEFRIVKGVKTTLDYTLGESVSVLKIERDGEEILFEGNRLNFTESGVYTVIAEAEGKTYSFVLELDSTAPTLELIGVKDGGVSGKAVMLDNLSEQATVEVFKDGELIEYELGNELKEYGEYRVVVTDEAGNQTEYGFTLKHVLNGGAVALIVIGIVVLVGGVAAVLIMRKKGIFGKIKAKKTDSEKPKKD